ncbi:MAG TPA: ABC transporter permease [Mollicutes bacterium]|nr:ABC transporter permease [Mollicutes bacterium]
MNRVLKLQKNFFKKNLKDIISFSIILFISTILLTSSLVINNNLDKEYNKKHQRLDTANNFFIISKFQYNDSLSENIKNIKGVEELETQEGIFVTIPVQMEDSLQDQNVIFYKYENERKINKFDLVQENSSFSNKGIYLANYTYIHSGLSLEDDFKFELNNKKYEYNINGIIEEMQYGNYNSSVIAQYLTNHAYLEMLENNKEKEIITISVKSNNSYDTYNEISKYLSRENIDVLSKNYDEQAKTQRLAIANILVLIVSAFSLLVLIVSLLVSKFKITQSIEEEITNMGILKALGYTSNEIITAIILPFLIMGSIVSIIGIIVSMYITPILAKVIEMQSGFIWIPKFDIVSSFITLIINIGLILIFTLLSARKIKKLNPINAIRGIENNKNIKNYFEIDKTIGNIGFVLTLKNFINSRNQNILLGIVIFFITIISSFAGILYYNVNINPDNFINTLVEEHPSVVITQKSDIKEQIKKYNDVKNIIYYDEMQTINYENNSYKTFVSETYKDLENDLCYEGKNPSEANEIAVGSKIKEKYNIKIGDYIEIKKEENTYIYKVVGFIQSVNYSGEVFELTLDGYKNIKADYEPKILYVYLDNEKLSNDFINKVKENFKDEILETVNYAESMESASVMYVSLVSVICIVIIVITIMLIYLVLYILVSSIILKRKQELGIYKSMGYKNNQLITQLMGGFLPSVIFSVILGIILNKLYIKNIYFTIFKAVGAYKISFDYPTIIFIIIGVAIVISTILIELLLSKKIKKISVYSLIKD